MTKRLSFAPVLLQVVFYKKARLQSSQAKMYDETLQSSESSVMICLLSNWRMLRRDKDLVE